jgi:DNA-binding transcriptional regulator YdaS (Cro superfamily)
METKTASQVAAERAISILGGPVKAARALNVKDHRHQTVQSWLKHRVPAEYCPAIERATTDAGQRVACEELRSDVDWGYLREQVGPLTQAS